MININDKVDVRMTNGRTRSFKVTRVQAFTGRPRQMNLDNGWDGVSYWVDGPRGAHHLCYRCPKTDTLHVVF